VSHSELSRYFGRPYLAQGSSSLVIDSGLNEKLGLRMSRAHIEWGDSTYNPKPWLKALYRIALDLDADVSPEATGTLPTWWTAAGGARPLGHPRPTIPWPAASWPALVDWERMIDAWNQAVVPAVWEGAEEARVNNSSIESFGDAAAYWFIRATMHVAGHRCILSDVPFESGFLPMRWTERISSQASEIRHQWGPRQDAQRRAFYQWFQAIGLFAAPESGLTVDAANAILDGISDLGGQIPHLMELRRERLRQPGIDDAAIEHMIATFNEQFPNHPWVERVETPYLASRSST